MYLIKFLFSLVLLLPAIFFQPLEKINNSIEIQSIGLKSNMYISYSSSTLKYGVVIDGNTLASNNWIVYGHRFSRYGADTSFLNLDKVEIGSEIVVRVKGLEYRYIVDEKFEVFPDELWSISQGSQRRITLVTCTPILYPVKRLVVTATLK